MKLPEKLTNLTPYIPSENKYRIKLDANENAETIPERIRLRAAQMIASADLNRYPDAACDALRRKAGAYFGIPAENLGVGCGSDELLSILVNNFVEKGGKVLVTEFDFSMYKFYAEVSGCEAIVLPRNDKLGIDADLLIETARREQPGMILFSNPGNPNGQGLKADVVRRIVTECDCLVVVDEAYMDFWRESVLADVGKYENLIVLRTCSKALGLAGVRCGFIAATETIIGYFNAVRSPYNMNMLTQTLAAAAFDEPDELRRMTELCVARADSLRLMARGLAAAHPNLVEYIHTVTNFVLIRPFDAEYCYKKLLERGICVRHLGKFLRISAGTDAENSEVIRALDELMTQREDEQ